MVDTRLKELPTEIDLFEDSVLLDPYPTYRRLRDAGPLFWMDRYGMWVAPSYESVQFVARQSHIFTTAPNQALEPNRPEQRNNGLLSKVPPEHTRLRAVLMELLSPRALKNLKSEFDRRAELVVAEACAHGTFDAVSEIARRFPLELVADLVGLPLEGRDHLLTLADAAFNAFGPLNERTRRTMSLIPELSSYLARSMTRGQLTAGTWGSAVYEAADRGEISEREGQDLLTGFLVAGIDTTINAIGSGIWLLAQNKDAWNEFQCDPDIAPWVFEEVLRFESPVSFFCHNILQNAEVAGVPVTEGQRIMTLFGSANRDESHYPLADTFDINRRATDHLTFGGGIHSCAGQGLARLEGASLLKALVRNVDRIELAGAPIRHLNNTLRGFESIPVSVVPTSIQSK